MARYDRIARISPPDRENAFPGWLVLRDLEGREREPELGRRARLRFLALRPVHRLLDQGMKGTDLESFAHQVEAARAELEQLPARDAERVRIGGFLRAVAARTPVGLAAATMEMGEASEAAGQRYAAEEFYLTGLEVARASGLPDHEAHALRSLGRLYGASQDWERSRACLEQAAALAESSGDAVAWARAMEGLALNQARARDLDGARGLLARVEDRAAETGSDQLAAIAAAGRCAVEWSDRRPEAAIEAGWRAVSYLEDGDEARNKVLLDMAAAFRALALRTAADACYQMVERSSSLPAHRLEARLEQAVCAAEAGDEAGFREYRDTALRGVDQDHVSAATLHLGLGRGAVLLEAVDDARAHLRQAMDAARAGGLGDKLHLAEELLASLEDRAEQLMQAPAGDPSDAARIIARGIESMEQALVASS